MVDRLTHTADEPDALHVKYRVFREPERVDYHPADVEAHYAETHSGDSDKVWTVVWHEIPEVEEFVFVLKPDTDQHARVALAAYAESVRPFKPRLAEDLTDVLSLLEVEGEAGVEGRGQVGVES